MSSLTSQTILYINIDSKSEINTSIVMIGAREAYTCLPGSSSNVDDFDMEEVSKYAVVKDSNASIQLTEWEERLFKTLVDAAIAYENNELVMNGDVTIEMPKLSPSKPIEIRIAGGWVRDKIMKQESHDVDIALDSMSGHQFATIVQQYLIRQMEKDVVPDDTPAAEETGGGKKKKKKVGSKKPKIAVIAANPSQSKHLETATMRVHNVDCDFVHLRGGEVYTSDSRIPTLKENATPLDDALRRDFTVNSLFYNLRTNQIEDWTGRGVSDLTNHNLLVTPLDAKITFHDDPLRVLRAVRFAVRYDLTLSEEIVTAAKSADVHGSLHIKVSRERVGKELEGMLSGKNAKPCAALRLLTDLKLAGCVFEFPHDSSIAVKGELCQGMTYNGDQMTEVEQRKAREMAWLVCAELIKYTTPLLQMVQKIRQDEESLPVQVDERIFYLSTFLYPLRKVDTIDAKGKSVPLPSYIIRDSIKFKNKDVQSVTTLLEGVDELRDILNDFHSNAVGNSSSAKTFCRLRVGLILRKLKDLWGTALMVAAIVEIHCCEGTSTTQSADVRPRNLMDRVEEYIPRMIKFLEMIHAHKLDGSWKMRPLLDGKDISKSLNLPKGPLIGNYIQEQVKWMLLNPDGTKADCETHLKAVRNHELNMTTTTSTETDVTMS